MARLLVVDDEEGLRAFLVEVLEAADGVSEVFAAASGDEAMALLERQAFDVVVTDLKMPGKDGLAVLAKVRAVEPDTQVILLTAHGTVETAVQAMKAGAFDYLQKPLGSPTELRVVVARALERRQLLAAREGATRAADDATPPLGYGDPAMARVADAIDRVARTEATVLLLGETGTGKEVAARTIHARSPRAGRPFVAINCAALSEALLESELFGHEKGAFTGAHAQRRGRLELCEGGTFFLDEVGELKPDLQAKLLRVLQERRFERVGGTRTLHADVRWVAATNRDLGAMMAAGGFREDLYHRLAVFPIRLPALRDRRQDLLPLAEALLRRTAAELGRPPLSLAAEARVLLERAELRGNIRELRNVLERAAILADGDTVEAEHIWLDPAPAAPGTAAAAPGGSPGVPAAAAAATADDTLEAVERAAIQRALGDSAGNRRRAAQRLGIGLRTLYEKLKRYGLS
jgi:two-component system, NtrC family, response regulator AtoC